MTQPDEGTISGTLGPWVRGPFLLFDKREGPHYAAGAGLLLLIIVAGLELGIGPRAHLLDLFGLPQPPDWLRIGLLLVLALAAARLVAQVRFSDIGFVPLAKWTATERAYVLEIALGAAVAFVVLRGSSLHLAAGDSAALLVMAGAVATQLLWGFYQEVVYRGLLQTELVRRFGVVAGVLLANLAFTFGPLHFYHLARMVPATQQETLTVMGATFAIGLLFAFIFHRTRNIWLAGLMHGVGNAFMNIAPT
jgi:membrane protease YdiL (CAAX protease family)